MLSSLSCQRIFQTLSKTDAGAKEPSSGLNIRQSCFLKKVACQSEANYKQQCYKQQCMVDGAILYHAHIGLNDWPETPSCAEVITTAKQASIVAKA